MKATNISTIEQVNGYNVEEVKEWHPESVRMLCVKQQWYTCGTNKEYDHMLEYVRNNKPVLSNIFIVAKDIFDHSENDDYGYEDEVIESIMFLLNSEAIVTSYYIS